MIHLDISLYYIGPPTGPDVPAHNMTAAVAECSQLRQDRPEQNWYL